MSMLQQQFAALVFVVVLKYTSAQFFVQSRCFQGDQYHFFAQSKTTNYTVARETCDLIGAKVVLVQNVEEMNFVHELRMASRPDQSIFLGMVAPVAPEDTFNPARFIPDDPAHYNLSFFEVPRVFPWGFNDPNDQSGLQRCVSWTPANTWEDRVCNIKNAVVCRNTCPPTPSPTLSPTTGAPTNFPTSSPTLKPTTHPTSAPTRSPSFSPTSAPTMLPTRAPTNGTTLAPTKAAVAEELVFAPSAVVVSFVGISTLMMSLGFFLYARRKTGSHFIYKDQGMVPPPDVDFEFTGELNSQDVRQRDSPGYF